MYVVVGGCCYGFLLGGFGCGIGFGVVYCFGVDGYEFRWWCG